ncbi:MAG: hypothetical protein ACOYYS_18715 [Chloroflexota bacterium]
MKKYGIIFKTVDTAAWLLIIIPLLTASTRGEPELTFQQYQQLSAAVNDAELAAADGIGGRHALLSMLLNQWGHFVTGASWQIVRFSQRLLDKGWKPGTEPEEDPDW